MSKNFRTCDLEQVFLLPPSLQDWLPENHLARFIADVTNELDLSKIVAVYERKDGRGMAAYHPAMMVRVLLYGYCRGVVSSRKIERATYEDVAFRFLAADQHPDHDSISSFRQAHLQSLAELFTQALRLCDKAGLIKLGHVAIDGTKLKANASKHKAMSYERMVEKEKQLREEVDKLLAQAAQADADEDAQYGKGKRGDELPAELARRVAEGRNQLVGASTEPPQPSKSVAETMRDKLRTTAGQAVYKMRKAVVEPVFGQITEQRGLRGFLMRGKEKVSAEWQIICLTHNLLKLFQAGLRPQLA